MVVALGSNLGGELGSSRAVLEAALGRFDTAGLTLSNRSSWWRSASWPDPAQPDYLNGVALVETALSAPEVLAALQRIEAELGREPAERNAPRVLDLDLIACGRLVVEGDGMTLPHPRAAERRDITGHCGEQSGDLGLADLLVSRQETRRLLEP